MKKKRPKSLTKLQKLERALEKLTDASVRLSAISSTLKATSDHRNSGVSQLGYVMHEIEILVDQARDDINEVTWNRKQLPF